MGEDEAGTLARLKTLRKELVQPQIAGHKGRVVKLMGDGLLAEFPSVVEAVECAVDIQRGVTAREAGSPDGSRVMLRIGVNLGDIIVEGSDLYGDGVNVAARLEAISEPGGVCISGTVFDHIKGKVDLDFSDLGEQRVKNIEQPVRVYRVVLEQEGETESSADRSSAGGPALPEQPSIAVLPFTNMSKDPDQEFFSGRHIRRHHHRAVSVEVAFRGSRGTPPFSFEASPSTSERSVRSLACPTFSKARFAKRVSEFALPLS